jgi:hypothetical protein
MDDGPIVKSVGSDAKKPAVRPLEAGVPSPETKGLIPIQGAPSGSLGSPPAGKSDPYEYWRNYYRTHDESPEQLRETLRLLNASGKPRDVHAVLKGYLTYRGRNAEPWMYEALAMAIEMNQGRPEDIKTALGFAADLAQGTSKIRGTHNPNDLVSVADKLFLKGYTDRVGALLDEAAEKVPHRSEPLVMSINLARQTKDPKRMASAIDRLLSLGWPGSDDYFRQESQKQADELAKALREDGRVEEADTLLASLPASMARDVFVRLTWNGDAGYELVVEEPLGAKAEFVSPRTVFGGAFIKSTLGPNGEAIYVCPRGFDGDYTIRVLPVYSDAAKPATRITVEAITHEGTDHEHKETFDRTPDSLDAPIVVKLEGGRRTKVLPFVNPAAAIAPALEQSRAAESKSRSSKDSSPNRAGTSEKAKLPSIKP